MLEFQVDNIFVAVEGNVFHQMAGILRSSSVDLKRFESIQIFPCLKMIEMLIYWFITPSFFLFSCHSCELNPI